MYETNKPDRLINEAGTWISEDNYKHDIKLATKRGKEEALREMCELISKTLKNYLGEK